MNLIGKWHPEEPVDSTIPGTKDFNRAADNICKEALNDARKHLHPLLKDEDVYRLRNRNEFVNALKLALERRIAQRLVLWYPNIQAVFKFDESWVEARHHWDGSLHLLVKIPRLSGTLKMLGKKLDISLMRRLQQLGWSRFHKHKFILEIQQVTPNELLHGIGYGAMFYAVYSIPMKIWPPKR